MKKLIIIISIVIQFCNVGFSQIDTSYTGLYLISDTTYLVSTTPYIMSYEESTITIFKSNADTIKIVGLSWSGGDTAIGIKKGNTFTIPPQKLGNFYYYNASGTFNVNSIKYIYYTFYANEKIEGHCTGVKFGTAINEVEAKQLIHYNNPLSDENSISFDSELCGSIFSLFNEDGKQLYSAIIGSEKVTVGSLNLLKGVLFYTVKNNDKTILSGTILKK